MNPHVTLHCDGACSPNPGLGGWAAVLVSDLDARSELTWHRVRGHSGDAENDRCDALAVAARKGLAEKP